MSRKQKWKGIPLNKTNIDEYMDDLYADTKGQYITQGVSFNKDDNFQMNLLKNALLAHGSFSGFVKHLMFNYFEDNDRLDDSIWIPNERVSNTPQSPTPPTVLQQQQTEVVETTSTQAEQLPQVAQDEVKEQEKPVPSPTTPQATNLKSVIKRPKMANGGSLKNALMESNEVQE